MSRPTHLLRHEHRVIEQALRALEGMCFRMRVGDRVPAAELAKLIDFIQGFADGFHHAREEALLFPALEQVGIRDEQGPLQFLRNEHELERGLLSELVRAVEKYGDEPAASEPFIAAARQFETHLLGHMEHEDAMLFRLAEELLDEPAKDALIRALAAEQAKNSAQIERYERLAGELEKAWAV